MSIYRAYGAIFLAMVMLGGSFFFVWHEKHHRTSHVLHICNWAHYLPASVIKKFEAQEGVKVVYDVFDAVETLEAKLLAASSGYDVVFPPLLPTGAVFLKAGSFSRLNPEWLPNRKYLDPQVMKSVRAFDRKGQCFIPYLWGTTGLAIHKEKVRMLSPEAPLDSWALIFNLRWLKEISPGRVSVLNAPSDFFSDMLLYFGKNPASFDRAELNLVADHFRKIKPFIHKFTSTDTFQDLLAERVCVAEVFSTYAHMAIQKTRALQGDSPYIYVIPKEGALMWIDVMAIPKDAPNKELAHRFINFLMKPEVIAEATNQIYAANAIKASQPFLKAWIKNEPTIYPPKAVMRKLRLDGIPPRVYERKRMRLWSILRAGY